MSFHIALCGLCTDPPMPLGSAGRPAWQQEGGRAGGGAGGGGEATKPVQQIWICTYEHKYISNYICVYTYIHVLGSSARYARDGVWVYMMGWHYGTILLNHIAVIYYKIILQWYITRLYCGTILRDYITRLHYGIILWGYSTEFDILQVYITRLYYRNILCNYITGSYCTFISRNYSTERYYGFVYAITLRCHVSELCYGIIWRN